jgi:cytochrome c oxidase subunit 2
MDQSFRLFPEQASNLATDVDRLYLFLWALSAFFTLLIFIMVVYLGLRYRRRSEEMPARTHVSANLEITWTVVPLFIVLGLFTWSSAVYVKMSHIPEDAMNVYIIGKQWMWQAQHPAGPRENNALHVPLGRPVKLTMTSQDVIHSFFIPAFRVKQDVLPGRYSYQWFTPTKVGTYHLFCAEYCGAQHSGMVGTVEVMEEAKYQAWLAGAVGDQPSAAAAGQKLFYQYQCNTCHGERAPTMAGLYLSSVQLSDGRTIVADDNYLRESIVDAPAKLVAGYPPLMPSYRGQLTDEQIVQLLEYIKSLKVPERNY